MLLSFSMVMEEFKWKCLGLFRDVLLMFEYLVVQSLLIALKNKTKAWNKLWFALLFACFFLSV